MDIRSQKPLNARRGKLGTLIVALLLLVMGPMAIAQEDVLTIEGAQIRGDQELPTVLYLVPWQPPATQALEPMPGGLAVKQTLQPLERSEFRRLVEYHQLFSQADASAGEKATPEGQPAP